MLLFAHNIATNIVNNDTWEGYSRKYHQEVILI